MDNKQIYCSLDIETTGFDPLKEEVLEVGFAFFEVSNKGIKITEEWEQVFKPTKEVSAQIMGLTGITKTEMEKAPAFSEHRDYIQEKLGNAIIVGHNINFDIKFLEGFGIKFSGQSIDTLDFVQWLLPTHHSYNLENLMHYFSISHKDAHRALADSKATLKLMEKLLQLFCGLPEKTKTTIKGLAGQSGFLWAEFLNLHLKPFNLPQEDFAKKLKNPKTEALNFEPDCFYNFSLEQDMVSQIAEAGVEKKVLLVLPRAQQALELFKHGHIQDVVFLPEIMYDPKKLQKLLKKKKLSDDEIKFILKILVWQETNWQNKTLLDLNLSFFGGQFKASVSGGKVLENKTAKIVACDPETFLYLSQSGLYKNRHVVICGLSQFEAAVSSGISTRAGWSYLNYLFKSFYNPENQAGDSKHKAEVEAGILASDLFFGLTSALLKTKSEGFEYFKVNNQTENDERWQKVKKAAESFFPKILEINKKLESKEIEKFVQNLENFFLPEDNRVKWLELAENRCVFFSMPLEIGMLVKNALAGFKGISFADSLDAEILPKFFLKRLGLENFKIHLSEKTKIKTKPGFKQGDLLAGLKQVFGKAGGQIKFHCFEQAASEKEIMRILSEAKPWPAVVLFGSPVQVKEFYEQNYQKLKEEVSLLAQTAYGGSNKILRNFGINKNSLMLVTDKLILKTLSSQSVAEPVNNLAVKTLILCRLPFEQFTHPYQEAVSQALPNAFEDYALPKAFYNFHNIIRFFHTPVLTDIYVVDLKLNKPYAKIFKEYWKTLPTGVNIA